MNRRFQPIPPDAQGGRATGKSLPPPHLAKWATMASNLALCGASVWLISAVLSARSDLPEFSALLAVLTAVQFLLVCSLVSILRRLKPWPHTPRRSFYRFAFAVGFVPLALSFAAVLSRWVHAL